MKNHLILLLLCICQNIYAQNLVLNPSFEEHKDERCNVYLSGFDRSILNWSTPNKGTTDYFDTCSKKMGTTNYNGFQEPKSGNTYAGIYVYTDKNYREYIQGELSETLKKGETYTFSFYLSLADNASYSTNDIEVLFTEEKLISCYHSNRCEKAIKPSSATKKRFQMYSDSDKNFFSNKTSWELYTVEFTANGYENYFSIGNFKRNSKTNKQRVLSNSPYLFSYYYIDEVSLTSNSNKDKVSTFETIEIDKVQDEEFKIKPNETYTFQNVLFEFDKSDLLPVSLAELNKLLDYLKVNSNLKIEIYGHTDNVGLTSRNTELSKERAKAVADYLILKGLNTNRIASFGFGSSKPISENKTDSGRQQNRRVEFKLLKL
ncbi:OmpA family protein [Winogradskyella litorisediminis]|uniref:OmpA family protein n=1 Tax=Winogradskyella litorisediminis TaxID=1156618 RepID=A0ABW3N892_9FLAO